MSVRDWSTTADDNGSSDPTINFAEGQMPSSVNNSARAMMAALAAYFADAGGKLISGGTSNAYTLTTNMGVTALGTPLTLMFEADRNNTGAATLSVDGLTAKPMVNAAGGALSSGDIVDGGVYFAVYNVTAATFVLLNVSAAVASYLSQAAEVTVASATTANILGAASNFVAVSGTTTITSFGTGANRFRFVRATGAFLITHNATSLICPTGANITTAAGDTFLVVSDASSNARVYAYQRATGAPLALDNKSVTYAKIQDVSATARALGRKTAGSGIVEELTLSELLDFIGSATSGDILYRGASAWQRLGKATDGNVLTLAAGFPAWAATAAGSLINIQSITASGTYTPTAGATKALAFITGGGGGGGSNSTNGGGGGGGGATNIAFLSSLSAQTATIGAGGSGGNPNGSGGGQSSLGSLSANGGSAGAGSVAGAGSTTTSGATLSVPGTNAFPVALSAGVASGANGGGSFWGTGGSNAGGSANVYGAGGGGDRTGTGGSGKSGVILILEFA